MAHDAPKLRGHTFSKPPDKFECWWDRVTEVHTLSDGSKRQFRKGFLFKFRFSWDKNWLNENDYSALCRIYNDFSSLTLYPRPDTYPSDNFIVQVTNDLNAKWWNSFLETSGKQGYEGSIEGEGFSITATATELL
jgi:hypothetical protein